MAQSIGVLTAGGDAPGLNAAIRALGKSAIRSQDWSVVGSFRYKVACSHSHHED